MERSEKLEAFAKAMAVVQTDIGGAKKSSVNPHFKSKYADLSAVWDAWQEVGPKNGFSVMQFPGEYNSDQRTMAMEQIVMHESGQYIASVMTIPLTKTDAQAYGSANTYARRYALAAAVGIAPADDDGNAASEPVKEQPINDAQFAELATLVEQSGADLAALCGYYKIEALKYLPSSKFGHARANLVKKLSPKEDAA